MTLHHWAKDLLEADHWPGQRGLIKTSTAKYPRPRRTSKWGKSFVARSGEGLAPPGVIAYDDHNQN